MKLEKYLLKCYGKTIKLGFRKSKKLNEDNSKGKKGSGFVFCDVVNASNFVDLMEYVGSRQMLAKYPSIDITSGVDEIIILKGTRSGKFWTINEYREAVSKGYDPWKADRKKKKKLALG